MINKSNCVCVCVTLFVQVSAFANFPISTPFNYQAHIRMDGSVVVWQDERAYGGSNMDIYGYDFETGVEFPICTAAGDQREPDISGNIVVWEDRRNDTSGDVYGYDLTTQSEFPICTEVRPQSSVCVDGNYVAWFDERNAGKSIYGYDLSTHQEFLIGADAYQSVAPSISGNFVVWTALKGGTGPDIYGYEFSTQTEFPICTAAKNQEKPVVNGNYVAWLDYRAGNYHPDLYCYDLSSGQESFVSQCNANSSIGNSGVYLVWIKEQDSVYSILAYNLINKTESVIYTGSNWRADPYVDNNIVLWVDSRNGNYDIYGYDLTTQEEFPVDTDTYNQEWPVVSGKYICWRDYHWGISATTVLSNDDTPLSTEILLGQVVSDSTAGASGADMTILGYNDFKDHWHYFIPATTDRYTVSVCGSDFDTTLAVFDENLIEVEFNDNFCGNQSKLILRGKAGKKYYVRVAGYDGDTGNYMLSIIKDSPDPLRSDINFDGIVNMVDLSIMAREWLSDNQN